MKLPATAPRSPLRSCAGRFSTTRRGEACYDPFLGSGSTLIAAESTGRICYGMDIDAKYVDVAVLRWQRFTGQQAVLDGDQRTFEEIARVRRREVA